MRNVTRKMIALGTALPAAATACEGCRPSVRAAIFTAGFFPTLAALLLPPALVGLIAALWLLGENRNRAKGFS